MKKQNGFTLIELIITVAIFGIMASIAVPNYSSFIQKSRKSSAYNVLVGTISLARIEAVKRSRVVTLCISTDQSSCDVNTETQWDKGWIVFVDNNGDNLVSTDDTVLKAEAASEHGINITSTFGSFLSIAPRGRLIDQGSFVICDSTGDSTHGLALNMWVTGLGRLATDDDGNGTVENVSGDNIDCSL